MSVRDRGSPNSPTQLAKLNVSGLLFGGMRGCWETLYTGPRNTTLGQVGGDTVTNLTLFVPDWVKGLELSGSV